MKSLVNAFEGFEVKETSFNEDEGPTKNLFFTSETICINEERKIYLFLCDFNLKFYEHKFYSDFEVELPHDVEHSVKKRQAEFLAGRYAAKKAMSGLPSNYKKNAQIQLSKDRSPIWPIGIIGSITHNSNKAVCVVTPDNSNSCIGIDLESHLSIEVSSLVGTSVYSRNELDVLTELGISENIAATLIFSAKESLFKALFPKVQAYFGFECANIESANLEKGVLWIGVSDFLYAHSGITKFYLCHFCTLEKNTILTFICQPSNKALAS
jgi:enterobactin synthetase component D